MKGATGITALTVFPILPLYYFIHVVMILELFDVFFFHGWIAEKTQVCAHFICVCVDDIDNT